MRLLVQETNVTVFCKTVYINNMYIWMRHMQQFSLPGLKD